MSIMTRETTITYRTSSQEETEKFGEELACKLHRGMTVLLFGELGAGKTTFTRGICRALGAPLIKSPSFVIINVYSGIIPIYHIDLYRTGDMDTITAYEIQEFIWDDDAIRIVEWAERLPIELIPDDSIAIEIVRISKNEREFHIEGLE